MASFKIVLKNTADEVVFYPHTDIRERHSQIWGTVGLVVVKGSILTHHQDLQQCRDRVSVIMNLHN